MSQPSFVTYDESWTKSANRGSGFNAHARVREGNECRHEGVFDRSHNYVDGRKGVNMAQTIMRIRYAGSPEADLPCHCLAISIQLTVSGSSECSAPCSDCLTAFPPVSIISL